MLLALPYEQLFTQGICLLPHIMSLTTAAWFSARVAQISIRFLLCIIFGNLASSAVYADERVKAITTFTVIADMARNVAGDTAIVESITKPGSEIHRYSPTPRDILRAQNADLVLWNGMNLELWFEQFFDHLSDVPQVTLSNGVQPLGIRDGNYQGKPNPHAWMSPDNAMIYVDNIVDAFSLHDPEHAEIYRRNGDAYKARITAAIMPLRRLIDRIPEDRRWLVTCEGAFTYLAQDLGLKELYLWPINADQQGTPQQVRKVIDEIRAHNIPAVFCESTVNNDPAKQIARETDAIFGGVLYVDSLSAADGPVPTYIDLLRVTTSTIVNGLVEAL